MYHISMVSNTKIDCTEKLGMMLPKSLLHTRDNKRGDITRSAFIRRAIESYLKQKGGRVKVDCLFICLSLPEPHCSHTISRFVIPVFV